MKFSKAKIPTRVGSIASQLFLNHRYFLDRFLFVSMKNKAELVINIDVCPKRYCRNGHNPT